MVMDRMMYSKKNIQSNNDVVFTRYPKNRKPSKREMGRCYKKAGRHNMVYRSGIMI